MSKFKSLAEPFKDALTEVFKTAGGEVISFEYEETPPKAWLVDFDENLKGPIFRAKLRFPHRNRTEEFFYVEEDIEAQCADKLDSNQVIDAFLKDLNTDLAFFELTNKLSDVFLNTEFPFPITRIWQNKLYFVGRGITDTLHECNLDSVWDTKALQLNVERFNQEFQIAKQKMQEKQNLERGSMGFSLTRGMAAPRPICQGLLPQTFQPKLIVSKSRLFQENTVNENEGTLSKPPLLLSGGPEQNVLEKMPASFAAVITNLEVESSLKTDIKRTPVAP